MSDKTVTLPIDLSPAEAATLRAVARLLDTSVPRLAAGVIHCWLDEGAAPAAELPAKPGPSVAVRRLAALTAWRLTGKGAVALTMTRVAKIVGRPVSRRTLYRWERLWSGGGLAALADGRSPNAPPSTYAPFLAAVKRIYGKRRVASPRPPKLMSCYRAACELAKREGWKVPHYRTAVRALATLRAKQAPAAGASHDVRHPPPSGD